MLQQSNLPALDFFNNVNSSYDVDEDILSTQTIEETVSVPKNQLNVTQENLTLFHNSTVESVTEETSEIEGCFSSSWSILFVLFPIPRRYTHYLLPIFQYHLWLVTHW